MKKSFIIAIFLSFNVSFAQVKDKPVCFSEFEFGAYGGINFNTVSEFGGNFLIELKTDLISNLNLRLSLGYSKSFMLTSYNVKTYVEFNFDTSTIYQAMTYDILKKGYDVFPIFLGFQYIIKNQTLSPYILLDLNYNFLETKIYRSPAHIWTYDSFDKLPNEYRTKHSESSPKTSYGISFGVGALYQISQELNLDFRYFFKSDKKIVNTHQFLVGITF